MKKKQIRKTIKSVMLTIAAISVFSMVSVLGFNIYMADVFGGVRYTEFDEQRRLEMTDLYGIKLTDDVELKEYSADVGFSDKTLLMIKTDDRDSFIKNCLPKDAEMVGEDEFRYSNVIGRIAQNDDGTYTIRLIR